MSYNPYRANRRAFANPTITTNNYVGDLKDPIITAALSAGDTLANNWVRKIDGIHHKAQIATTSMSDPLVAASCAFSSEDSLTLDDKVLTLVDLQVNEEICRATVYPTFQGQSGSRTSSNMMRQEFVNHVLELTAAKTAEQVETLIWQGGVGVTGFLGNNGALALASGSLSGATVYDTNASLSASTIITHLGGTYQKAADSKPAILSKSDLAFYVSPQTYAFYLAALATAGSQGYANQVTNQGFAEVNYLGVPVHRCPGVPNQCIVLGQSENLIVGTNAGTDMTQVEFIPVYQYDGSDNVRVVMRMGINTIAGIGADVVVGYNAA